MSFKEIVVIRSDCGKWNVNKSTMLFVCSKLFKIKYISAIRLRLISILIDLDLVMQIYDY